MKEQRIGLKDIDISLEGSGTDLDGRITGAQSLTVKLSADDTVDFEAGSYLPTEIVQGRVTITGEVSKAYLNNTFFKLFFPQTDLGDGRVAVIRPTFTLKGKVNNSKSPKREMEIYGVVFSDIDITDLTTDSNISKQTLPFNATGYKFLD